MPIIITDSDNISTIHTAERLQINLLTAKENVEEMYIEVFFIVETRLPPKNGETNGKTIGFPHWDNKPLILNCKNDEELTQAMQVIQNRIGVSRYLELTTLKEEISSEPINYANLTTD